MDVDLGEVTGKHLVLALTRDGNGMLWARGKSGTTNVTLVWAVDLAYSDLAIPADVRVRNIQRAHVKAFVLKLRQKLSRASTKLAYTTLRSMLNAAIDDGVIALNPTNRLARGLGLGKSRDEEDVKAFTREQVNLFMETARKVKPHYFPIFLTLYQSGVRIGECVGLQWNDLKLEPKVREVEVQRSIDDKTGEVGTPKNAVTL